MAEASNESCASQGRGGIPHLATLGTELVEKILLQGERHLVLRAEWRACLAMPS